MCEAFQRQVAELKDTVSEYTTRGLLPFNLHLLDGEIPRHGASRMERSFCKGKKSNRGKAKNDNVQ
jgi:hypothetical protein